MLVTIRYVCAGCGTEYHVSTPNDEEASRPRVWCHDCGLAAMDQGAIYQDQSGRAPGNDGGAGERVDKILSQDSCGVEK